MKFHSQRETLSSLSLLWHKIGFSGRQRVVIMTLKRGEMTCFGRLGVLRYMMLCEPYFIKFAEEKFSCIL